MQAELTAYQNALAKLGPVMDEIKATKEALIKAAHDTMNAAGQKIAADCAPPTTKSS